MGSLETQVAPSNVLMAALFGWPIVIDGMPIKVTQKNWLMGLPIK